MMKSLVIDDDFGSRMLLQRFLMEYGPVDAAPNGTEGLRLFRAAPEGEPYNLICLDIMLPDISGQTVLKEIRATESARGGTRETGARIFMTTALQDKENVLEARPMCDAYLAKPFTRATLVTYLRKHGLIP